MDVKALRERATAFGEDYGGGLGLMCKDMLRILDAFEVMERRGLSLTYVKHIDGSTSYWLCKPESPVIHSGKTILEALLAAAQALEGKTDG